MIFVCLCPGLDRLGLEELWRLVWVKTDSGRSMCYADREVERVETGAEWSGFEGRDRKTRTDLQQQQRAAARRDQTVKRLNWGFGFGEECGGGH